MVIAFYDLEKLNYTLTNLVTLIEKMNNNKIILYLNSVSID